VRPRSSCDDELVAHLARKRQIDECVPVEVAQLALSKAELDSTKAMRGALDPWPVGWQNSVRTPRNQ
jgi:hypothetical protein